MRFNNKYVCRSPIDVRQLVAAYLGGFHPLNTNEIGARRINSRHNKYTGIEHVA